MRTLYSLAGLAALASIGGAQVIDVTERPARVIEPKRRPARTRVAHRSNHSERKEPVTQADFDRVEAAEHKRARKAAKLARTAAAGGFGGSAEGVAAQVED